MFSTRASMLCRRIACITWFGGRVADDRVVEKEMRDDSMSEGSISISPEKSFREPFICRASDFESTPKVILDELRDRTWCTGVAYAFAKPQAIRIASAAPVAILFLRDVGIEGEFI